MDRIMAVLTKEKIFAERFCGYINRKNLLSIMAVPFSSIDECADYSRKHNIELLIADYSFSGRGYEPHSGSADDIRAGRRIYLSEEPAAFTGLSEPGPGHPYGAGDVLTKYQPAEKLLDEIIACTGSQEFLRASGSGGRKAQVIGIFSPLGRCGKTSFALTLCRLLGHDHRVLYLDLDEFSGISGIFGYKGSEGISEAIYDLRRGVLDQSRIRELTVRSMGIDWIPPVKSPEDYCMISGADYVSLVNEILRLSDYEYIVADMDRFSGQADVIMDICSTVFIPAINDPISSGKAEAFISFLKSSREKGWLERIRYIILPEAEDSSACSSEYLDSLCLGRMGDVVRSLEPGL